MMWQTGAAIALSYAVGSIPTGFWMGKWLRGIDIREHGSCNIGATNTLRVLGKKLLSV
ncbi:MAG: glycerol-3-phosphate acyltransferase [Candidatus Hydrogenedentota bacterium]